MPDYYCSVCKAQCFVENGQVRRACVHAHAAVIAERTSVLYGAGSAAGAGLLDRVIAALASLARSFGVK